VLDLQKELIMNNQKVKLQISSDIEDVTRVSSVLLEEALLHVNDLVSLITEAKTILRNLNLSSVDEVKNLNLSLEYLNSTRIPMNKIDNRLSDVVAIVDGLNSIIIQKSLENNETKKEINDDNVLTR
jgi:hypothetical protein